MKALPKHLTKVPSDKKEKGFVLILVMLLITILSLLAFVSMEQSQLSYKSNNARLAQIKARQISEDARLMAINKLESLLQNNNLKINVPTSDMSLSDKPSKSIKSGGLQHFFSVSHKHTRADVYIKELPNQQFKNGVSLSQNMAYSGLGLGLGSYGSFSARYELRSKGVSSDNGYDVVFWTASDYRFIP
ncbi:MAG: type II secretory pathway pseudopilin PulG [Oleiphilaceae bacterium]|jgi:type II secretory pathway pseudopilin PulG